MRRLLTVRTTLFFLCVVIILFIQTRGFSQEEEYDIAKNHLPNYAGHYYDNDQLIVLMKNYESNGLESQSVNPTKAQILEVLNEQFIGESPRNINKLSTLATLNKVEVLSVTYDYVELYEWREKIEQEFFVIREYKGGGGIDVIDNKIQVGFDTTNSKTFQVLSKELNVFLKKNNIPNKAVDITRVIFSFANTRPPPRPPPPPKNANNYLRPFMMNFDIQANDRFRRETGHCSIGFFVKKGRSYGFVTAHHCISWEHNNNLKLSSPLKWGQDSGNETSENIGTSTSSSTPRGNVDAYYVELKNSNYDRNDFPWFNKISQRVNSNSNGEFSSTKTVVGIIPEYRLMGKYVMLPSRTAGRVYGRVSTTFNYSPPGHFIRRIEGLYCFKTQLSSSSIKGTSGSSVVFADNGRFYVAGIISSVPYFSRNGKYDYHVCFHSYRDVERALGVSIAF